MKLHPHATGLLGLPNEETEAVHRWYRRFQWLPGAAALLSIPAFYMHLAGNRSVYEAGSLLYLALALAMLFYLGLLAALCRHRLRFLTGNWLDVGLAVGVLLSALTDYGSWSHMAVALRLGLVGLVFVRLLFSLRALVSPSGLAYVLACAAAMLAVSGAGFYWLEPTVHSYTEGVWLAFVSVATVGYGDIVPTTPASRLFAAFIILMGLGVVSLVTAAGAAIFVGEDDRRLRSEMHSDIRALRKELEVLREEVRRLHRS